MRPRTRTSMLLASGLALAVSACGGDRQQGVTSNATEDRVEEPAVPDVETSAGDDQQESAETAGEVAAYFLRGDADVTRADGYERVSRDDGDGASVEDQARVAVGALAEGPNAEERERGLTSPFSVAVGMIRDVTFNDGTLVVDFEEGLTSAVNLQGDHWGPELLAPLMVTVFEIPEVQSLELWGEGSCATFVSWASFDLQGYETECVARSREQAEGWKAQPPPSPTPDFPNNPPEVKPPPDSEGEGE